RGSSHGQTRIIRQAYFEHPDYVPLCRRAYELWRDLESETGRELMHLCGLMLAGPTEGEAIAGARRAAELHGVGIENVAPEDARRRFRGFRFADADDVVFEANAGSLDVEDCVRAHVERAVTLGADLRTGETVIEWRADADSVHVRTGRNEYHAGRLIIAAGAWAGPLLSDLSLALRVLRKPVAWFPVATRDYDAAAGAPAFYFERPAGAFYGFPCLDGSTLKLAEHTGGEAVADPLRVDRSLRESDVAPLAAFLRETLPGVAAEPVRHSVCMYTHSMDGHFLVGYHPRWPNVLIAAGFSGHGFKFTGVIGESLADLATDGRTDLPINFLSPDRTLAD
ncbi:MAG: N-methyl-L-tryptophan oxidase, partial [Planctomycetaceae bacterium]